MKKIIKDQILKITELEEKVRIEKSKLSTIIIKEYTDWVGKPVKINKKGWNKGRILSIRISYKNELEARIKRPWSYLSRYVKLSDIEVITEEEMPKLPNGFLNN